MGDGGEKLLVHHVAGRFFVYDANTVRVLREKHHLLGCLVGTLAQASQQNIFLGLPLHLFAEEVIWLVVHGHADIVNDSVDIARSVREADPARLAAARAQLAQLAAQHAEQQRQAGLARKWAALAKQGMALPARETEASASSESSLVIPDSCPSGLVGFLRDDELTEAVAARSHELRYAVFAHLHARGLFMHPGLRFGAEFVAYPGDPLRFHSHYSVTTAAWQQPIPVLSIVGSGRLGTTVKKSWLLATRDERAKPRGRPVRCFCIEWAGF